MKISLLSAICIILLTGCASYPVYSETPDNETFVGMATSYIGGSGRVKLRSSEGVACKGKYEQDTSFDGGAVIGNGSFQCDDKRTGNFSFAGNASSGQGAGKLSDGKKFDFYFGDVAIVKSK
jgi:hypothetical protein